VAQKPKPSKGKFGPKGVNWTVAKSWYVNGWEGVDADGNPALVFPTLEEIALKLGVIKQTAQARAASEDWTGARATHRAELERRANEAAIKALVDARIRVRQKALSGAEKILDRVDKAMDAVPADNGALAFTKALPSLALAARQAQQTAHVAIGLPKDGVMPGPGGGGGAVTLWARLRGSRAEVGVVVELGGPQEPEPLTVEAEALTG
jgi:hypothetical protein